MKKRMTLVVILDDSVVDEECGPMKPLESMTNEQWAEHMKQVYGNEPTMALESVTVENVE